MVAARPHPLRRPRPIAIVDAEMAPMLGPDGAPLAARGWYDTESIAQDGGVLYVGIERVHQIVRFDYEKDGLLARGYPIDLPRAVRSLPSNKGLEALVFIPSDTLWPAPSLPSRNAGSTGRATSRLS